MRGLYYFEGDLVSMKETARGWEGYADGYERYKLFIAPDADGLLSPAAKQSFCSCPHAADGYFCKHLAAACYAIEEELSFRAESGVAGGELDESAHVLLERLDEETLRDFLRDIVSEDERWSRELLNRYGNPDAARVCRELSGDIRQAVRDHSYGGFIEWREAPSFEHEVNIAIGAAVEPLIERGLFEEALRASMTALEELRYVEIDDSDGFYSSAIGTCLEVWSAILAKGDPAAAEMLLGNARVFLMQEAAEREVPDILEYEKDDVEAWLVKNLPDNPAVADELLDIAREQLGEPNDESCYNGYYRSPNAQWALAGMRAMKTLGMPHEEQRAFALPYASNQEVLETLVEDALAQSDRAFAMRLLKEREEHILYDIEEAKSGDHWRASSAMRNLLPISTRILDLLEEEGSDDEVAGQLRRVLALDDQPACAAEHLDRLKELVGEASWEEELERVLANTSSGGIRREMLAHEGLVARLMDDIGESGSVHDLMTFEDVLKGDYASQLLAAYREKLEADLRGASSRNAYRSGVAILGRFGNIPGGEAARDAACSWIRATFPRRPALQDELKQRELTWLNPEGQLRSEAFQER